MRVSLNTYIMALCHMSFCVGACVNTFNPVRVYTNVPMCVPQRFFVCSPFAEALAAPFAIVFPRWQLQTVMYHDVSTYIAKLFFPEKH